MPIFIRFTAMRSFRPVALLILLAACATASPPVTPIFSFHDNFWMNLHHFVRAVSRGMPAKAAMTPAEQATWDEAVAFYRVN